MNKKQLMISGALFAIVVTILIIGYLSFLRPNYIVLFDNMREADTSTIIAELEDKGISYELQEKGRKILVAEDDVSQAKVAIAASPMATGGAVGFELFNESDMGLTDFAQKINFQRALQGELARTIMSMDDIEYSRVHLSLPERSLFRADASPPKAAITIKTKNRITLNDEKVKGLRQLVSSSVPNLAINNVVVLDETGASLNKVNEVSVKKDEEVDERAALETYFRVRSKKVIKEILPTLNFDVNVVASPDEKLAARDVLQNNDTVDQEEQEAKISNGNRNFKLSIIVRTIASLNEEDRAYIQDSLVQSLSLDLDDIDLLAFETGALGAGTLAVSSNTKDTPAFTQVDSKASKSPINSIDWLNIVMSKWFLLLCGIVLIIVTLFYRQRSRLNEEEHQTFADQLTDVMNSQEGYSNG